ncbi:hypothetical protein [Lactococcus garvieae]|uniref:hypothetical protein n=1 Tax=Lactococcus garvieae TaxID=1363 RepID=UPI00288EE2EE|nr:hypothetical protein [Lactococcus garvieae]MDT2742363.1 hypothetical protein [Lactococcus garvieae]
MKIKKIILTLILGLSLFVVTQLSTAEKASADGVFGDRIEKLERAVRILQSNFTRHGRQVAYYKTFPDAAFGKKTLTSEYYNWAVRHQSNAYVQGGGNKSSGWYPAGYKVWVSSTGYRHGGYSWSYQAVGNKW